jgi:hypothetical protein
MSQTPEARLNKLMLGEMVKRKLQEQNLGVLSRGRSQEADVNGTLLNTRSSRQLRLLDGPNVGKFRFVVGYSKVLADGGIDIVDPT